MPVPGPEILRRISEFAAAISGSERESRDRAEEISKEIETLLADQSSAFLEFAKLYLPRLEDDVEREGWTEMRSVLRDAMLRRDDAKRVLEERLSVATRQYSDAESQWKSVSAQLTVVRQQVEDLSKQLTDKLSSDPELQSLSKAVAEGQARLEQATANLEAVEGDAKTKLPSYEQSRLFQYLWRSEFETDRYGRRGISRRIDRWLARLIDYSKASGSYRFLTSAPRMMRQVIEEQQKIVKSGVDEVERRQRVAADAMGLPAAQSQLSKLAADHERLIAAMETADKNLKSIQHDLTELNSPDSIYYRDALKAFQTLMQKTERSLVAARAANTPEMTDDQVVARVRHIDERVQDRKSELERQCAITEAAEQRIARVNDLLSRCRRAQFDHPKRLFEDSYDLTTRLNDLAKGSVTAETMYQEMYRIQRLDSPIADQASAAINGPMGQILMHTMAQAAGVALGAYAARAGQQHRMPKNRPR